MSWRVLMNAENEHFRSQEQKEQKGVSEGAFAPFATIAHKGQKVKNVNRQGKEVDSRPVLKVKVNEYKPILCPYKGELRKIHPASPFSPRTGAIRSAPMDFMMSRTARA